MHIEDNTGADASVSEAVVENNTVTEKAPAPEAEKTAEEKPEAEEGSEGEKPEGSDEAEEGEGEEKPTKSKLRREKTKARIAELEAQVRELAAKAEAADKAKPSDDVLGPKPDRAKYEDEAEYIADLAAWKAEEKAIQRQQKAHEMSSTAARSDASAKKMELFRERAMALTDSYPDIEAKVFKDPSLPMSQAMAEVIMESEKGPEVAYHLSANREVAQRIASMPPLAAARELGRIEATLSLPKSKTQTTAPTPPNTLKGTSQKVSVDPNTLHGAAYRAWRAKQG